MKKLWGREEENLEDLEDENNSSLKSLLINV